MVDDGWGMRDEGWWWWWWWWWWGWWGWWMTMTFTRECRDEATLFELVYGLHVWHRQIAHAGFYRWARTKWNNTDFHTQSQSLTAYTFCAAGDLDQPPFCRKIHHGRRQGKCSATSSTTETALMFQGSCPKSSTTWLRKASLADFNMTPKDKIPNAAQDLKPLQPGALVHPPTVSDPGLWPHSHPSLIAWVDPVRSL